ncbi:hypothetical protein SAMN05421630_10225 [Prauserella marina]|uniref:Uncharacterized protein n=2 Tax=Prauserella marina TaxID=530584 RepID=A0A1G6LH54_9PSEU|nr:hypothetical protein DES30_1011967 [Prauserella marina]SDC41896.1 hypothetical protein SAMN05421630_10225 [Prauserella marina]
MECFGPVGKFWAHEKESMSRKVLFGCRVLAGSLVVWALYLFLSPTTLSYRRTGVEISCHSVARTGWGDEPYLDKPNSRSYKYFVEAGDTELDEVEDEGMTEYHSLWEVTDRMDNDCNQKRTNTTALMSLVLAPAVVLGIVGFVVPARREPEAAPRY